MIIRKTPSELEKMRRSGLLVHKILHALGAMVEEGISTWDLELAAVKMADAGQSPRSRITLCRRQVNGIDTCSVPR